MKQHTNPNLPEDQKIPLQLCPPPEPGDCQIGGCPLPRPAIKSPGGVVVVVEVVVEAVVLLVVVCTLGSMIISEYII